MSVSHIAGRFIKFTIGTTSIPYEYEFEVVSGSVSDTAEHEAFLPVGRTIMNVVTHGRTVIYTFQGVLLVDFLPWNEWEAGTLTNTTTSTTTGLTPGTALTNLYVTLNRGGTQVGPGDAIEDFLDEVYHYSANAQVISIEHAFDTGTHQVFNVQIMADGSYETPQLTA